MPLPDYEKLGAFYLGKHYDLDARKRQDAPLLYDSKDLVTHAVCVGMTGSGKTGLLIGLLEEAAIDGIPAILIDPKGDLANLLLTFPQLRPQDFAPWINEDDARKKGQTPAEFAASQAALWSNGLAEWGQDGARIQRLKNAADFTVYTPASSAGVQVSVLKSFQVPGFEVVDDAELYRERISSTVSSLLALMGVESDPMQGREHILLASIFENAWSAGQELDLASLVTQIQSPPMQRVGVMELESFFPPKDRFKLAMALNNLIASPGFSRWAEGEPLDIKAMLFSPQGKPRHAIFSIAHLGDAERMFFVSLLMNAILGWVRTQSGTSSLRAIIYMDEIAGYFPPTANPPSKQPMLTLMKQARAFGVGMVLATQNPVDLDYKGLSNAGTWFIGRLQTERDKQRVLDGLEGAAAQAPGGFDRARCDALLSQLGARVFLMNNVHDDGPTIFESRWALSYLRGPLTRGQIKQLTDAKRASAAVSAVAAQSPPSAAAPPVSSSLPPTAPATKPTAASTQPVLPPDVPQYFLPARATGEIVYVPMLLGTARVYYADARAGIDCEVAAAELCPIGTGPLAVDWDHADLVDLTEKEVEKQGGHSATFAPLPPEAGKAKSYEAWKKSFGESLFRTHKLDLFKNPSLKLSSKPGEAERDFKARVAQLVREQRDEQVEKLRSKYAPKLAALQERHRRAQQRVEVEREQARDSKIGTALSFGSAILGAFLGRKMATAANVSKASTAMRGVSRSAKQSADIDRAEETAGTIQQQIAELEANLKAQTDALGAELERTAGDIEQIVLKPKKINITVRTVLLVWAPHVRSGSGLAKAW